MCGVCHAIRPTEASPCGACLSRTFRRWSSQAGAPHPGPTLLGVQGLGAGGARALGLATAFFREPGPEILRRSARRTTILGALPLASEVYRADSSYEGRSDSQPLS